MAMPAQVEQDRARDALLATADRLVNGAADGVIRLRRWNDALRVAATSTASEIAMPRLPLLSGVVASTCRPPLVSFDGLATQRAPKVSMNARRYGF